MLTTLKIIKNWLHGRKLPACVLRLRSPLKRGSALWKTYHAGGNELAVETNVLELILSRRWEMWALLELVHVQNKQPKNKTQVETEGRETNSMQFLTNRLTDSSHVKHPLLIEKFPIFILILWRTNIRIVNITKPNTCREAPLGLTSTGTMDDKKQWLYAGSDYWGHTYISHETERTRKTLTQ